MTTIIQTGILALLARLLLATVFLVAGVAKWRDPAGTGQALKEFGLPAALARRLRRLLPAAELVVAVALIIPQTAWLGSVLALALLVLFSVAIAVNLARGETPDCNCFGQLSSKPIGGESLLRNLAFVLPAAYLAAIGPESAGRFAWSQIELSQFLVYGGALLVVLLVGGQTWLSLSLLRRHGSLLLRIDELESQLRGEQRAASLPLRSGALGSLNGSSHAPAVGEIAPEFRATAPDGTTRTLSDLRGRGKPVLLLFVEPGCGPCQELLPDVRRWQSEHLEKLTIALISSAKNGDAPLPSALVQRDGAISKAYGVNATPVAVLIRADGAIGSTQARGPQQIRTLLQQALTLGQRPGQPPRAHTNGSSPPKLRREKAVQRLPELELPDLEGNGVRLAAIRRQLLVFWNPGCGYCQRLLDDFRRWEVERPEDMPEPLIISTGSVEANRALNLRSRVLLDDNFALGRAVGARGTPAAILVDADGKIASRAVAGGPAVMALAQAAQEAREEVHHEPVA